MEKCEFCGKEILLPFQCSFCNGNFCVEHRLPENHACPRAPPRSPLGSWKAKPQYGESKAILPQISRFEPTTSGKTHWKKPRIRPLFTSLKLWFPLFAIAIILLVYMEADNPVQFYQTVPPPVKYSIFAFAFVIGLLSGYRVFKKCDYNPKSDAGIFGLKLLSGGILFASFLGLFFGFYLLLFAGYFTPYEQFRTSLATETLGVFFIALSCALLILSGYLLFKFQRKSGIIVYPR